MNAKATQALDRLAHEFGGDMLGEIATRDELLTAAFIELREEVAALRRKLEGSPPSRVADDRYVSLLVAAREIGRSNEFLRQRAVRGDIEAVFSDGKWRVRIDEVCEKYRR
jgi:hypothetical protein